MTAVNEVYSPTQEQFDRAWDILDAYEKATATERKGAVMFGDEMIDEASRKMATKFVTRGSGRGCVARRRDSPGRLGPLLASIHRVTADADLHWAGMT